MGLRQSAARGGVEKEGVDLLELGQGGGERQPNWLLKDGLPQAEGLFLAFVLFIRAVMDS